MKKIGMLLLWLGGFILGVGFIVNVRIAENSAGVMVAGCICSLMGLVYCIRKKDKTP